MILDILDIMDADGLYLKRKRQVVLLFEFIARMSIYMMLNYFNAAELQNNLTKIMIPQVTIDYRCLGPVLVSNIFLQH